MATAKKLPSGSWRCLAYSHTEKVMDEKTGKKKNKRIYESFTSNIPGPQGKREAEAEAALFQLNKSKTLTKKKPEYGHITLTEAIDRYIESRVALKRSPTTIQDYRCIQQNGFQDLMDTCLKDLDKEILQEAINVEARRPVQRWKEQKNKKPISAKRLKNEWGLITAVLKKYRKGIDYDEFEFPQIAPRVVELPSAQDVLNIVKGTTIELPVLLAMWLSFSMSEVRGLTKSNSISPDGNYISINEVIVDVNGQPLKKSIGKNPTRNRRHRIPPYIKELINQVESDTLVPMSGHALYHRWIRLQTENGMSHITFHDLRHLSASVMALLRVPDKYAQERGGWKSDNVMKKVYMQTFSDERKRVDDVVDDYFNGILYPDKKDNQKIPVEIEELLKSNNSDGRYNTILEYVQHEMQHEKEKPL